MYLPTGRSLGPTMFYLVVSEMSSRSRWILFVFGGVVGVYVLVTLVGACKSFWACSVVLLVAVGLAGFCVFVPCAAVVVSLLYS